jgi:hypothetical protein
MFARKVNRGVAGVVALMIVAAATTAQAADPWMWVSLPDTQNYSDEYPHVFAAQTQWIADNAAANNIKFVTHLGDITDNHGDIRQWNNAKAAMSILDNANMPYGTAYGNHDIHYGGGSPPGEADYAATNYLNYFGPQHYTNKDWYAGASPTGKSNYQVIEYAPGKEMLFLHLSVETPVQELAWAQGVLNNNRDKPVHVSTHRYMQDSAEYVGALGSFLGVPPGRYPDIWYQLAEPLYQPDGVKAEVFFNTFIKPNKNIFMVECGHFHAEYNQTSTNNYGLPVQEILVDYQDDPNGGNGWLRTMTVKDEQDKIEVRTYSPYLNQNNHDGESHFDLSVDLDNHTYAPGTTAVTFQNGVSGYTGTQDTYVDQHDPNTSHGNHSTIVVDDDTDNHWWNEYEGQGLIKFENIIGGKVYEGDALPTGLIPDDATITRADMTVNVVDDIDDPRGAKIKVYRMNRDWHEGSTWNSLGSGAHGDLGELVAEFDGDNNPNGNTPRTFSILGLVESWQDGTANNGVAILPIRVDFQDDGIEIASSENGDTALRPKLDVEFTYTIHNRAPDITQTLTASALTINEGDSIDFSFAASDANPNDPLTFRLNGEVVQFAAGSGLAQCTVDFFDEGTGLFSSTVTDDEDTVNAGSLNITVLNVAPTLTSLTHTGITVGAGAVIDAHFLAEATDPGFNDVLSYAWDLNYDGQTFQAEVLGNMITHALHAGMHSVGVRVDDGDGGVQTAGMTVQIPSAVALTTDYDGVTDGTVIAQPRVVGFASNVLDIADATHGCVLVDALTNWPNPSTEDEVMAVLWLTGDSSDWLKIRDDLSALNGVQAFLAGDAGVDWDAYARGYDADDLFSMLVYFRPVAAPQPYPAGTFYFGWDFDGVAVDKLTVVPEPTSLLVISLSGMFLSRRRRA